MSGLAEMLEARIAAAESTMAQSLAEGIYGVGRIGPLTYEEFLIDRRYRRQAWWRWHFWRHFWNARVWLAENVLRVDVSGRGEDE